MKFTDIIKPENISTKLLWETFSKKVYPGVVVDSVQYKQLKQCFYAGSLETFESMSLISSECTEDVAFTVLDRMHKETELYFRELIAKLKEEGKL